MECSRTPGSRASGQVRRPRFAFDRRRVLSWSPPRLLAQISLSGQRGIMQKAVVKTNNNGQKRLVNGSHASVATFSSGKHAPRSAARMRQNWPSLLRAIGGVLPLGGDGGGDAAPAQAHKVASRLPLEEAGRQIEEAAHRSTERVARDGDALCR